MTIDTAKLRLSTKKMIGLAFAVGGLMQIPAVNAMVTPWLASHPRLAPMMGMVAAVWALLHNPMVEDALGIKETVTVTQEKVMLAPTATTTEGTDGH